VGDDIYHDMSDANVPSVIEPLPSDEATADAEPSTGPATAAEEADNVYEAMEVGRKGKGFYQFSPSVVVHQGRLFPFPFSFSRAARGICMKQLQMCSPRARGPRRCSLDARPGRPNVTEGRVLSEALFDQYTRLVRRGKEQIHQSLGLCAWQPGGHAPISLNSQAPRSDLTQQHICLHT
jgi:hypothetical protein